MSDRSLGNAFSIISNVVSMLTLSSIELMLNCKGFVGVNLKRLSEDRPDVLAEIFSKILELFAAGKLRTSVTKTYKWQQINEAHKDIESRGTTGKLIMEIDSD